MSFSSQISDSENVDRCLCCSDSMQMNECRFDMEKTEVLSCLCLWPVVHIPQGGVTSVALRCVWLSPELYYLEEVGSVQVWQVWHMWLKIHCCLGWCQTESLRWLLMSFCRVMCHGSPGGVCFSYITLPYLTFLAVTFAKSNTSSSFKVREKYLKPKQATKWNIR